ncbi:hypothetical protein MG293_001033 [Ovis ammon polii]|uniref:Uncharacterized protein n=1 Tax=Ovis ammon polii TaxID=230172 RepID=A0AAD4UK50_OVIAM|nr:hypothetical protein MG293_001033 [Ovis ammon polii]
MFKEQRLCRCRRAERSYSTFKVRKGDLVQGKEQQLRFAGAAVKRYPTSKARVLECGATAFSFWCPDMINYHLYLISRERMESGNEDSMPRRKKIRLQNILLEMKALRCGERRMQKRIEEESCERREDERTSGVQGPVSYLVKKKLHFVRFREKSLWKSPDLTPPPMSQSDPRPESPDNVQELVVYLEDKVNSQIKMGPIAPGQKEHRQPQGHQTVHKKEVNIQIVVRPQIFLCVLTKNRGPQGRVFFDSPYTVTLSSEANSEF